MDTVEVERAVANFDGLDVLAVRPIQGGWASWTFEINGRFIVRFPRTAEIADRTTAELGLLPRLAQLVNFAVPQVRWRGLHNGWSFFVYEAIPGRPLRRSDLETRPELAGELALALRSLHAVALGELAGSDLAGDAWRARYRHLRAQANERALPLLDDRTADALQIAWQYFDANLVFAPVLVHADLGPEHLLIDDGRLSGIIDWETAGPGDPAIDFVGLHLAVGPDWAGAVLDAYEPTDPSLAGRIPDYAWLGSVHAILYGLDERRDDIVTDGIVGLRQRLPTAQ